MESGMVVADASVIGCYLFVSPCVRCSCLLEGLLASICIHIRKLELLPALAPAPFTLDAAGPTRSDHPTNPMPQSAGTGTTAWGVVR
jgi:hypothetical protein